MKIIKNTENINLESNIVEINTLKLGEMLFPLKNDLENNFLVIYKHTEFEYKHLQNENIKIYLDLHFEEKIYNYHEEDEEDYMAPSFCFATFDTGISNIDELIGTSIIIESLEESFEREDSMYIWEHEPFMNYTLTVLEFKENTARVLCSGEAIINGYSEPYTTEQFCFDCYVPLRNRL